jgi:hypothetical protein
MTDQIIEKFWTPEELAEKWNVSNDTVLRILETQAGVINFGNARSKRRKYRLFRVPENIVRIIEATRAIQ